jgi:cysteinyl-tRNA synthetase
MDLQFPHHESEIAQSTICNHHNPARYWIHNNMITVNGRKMGKSYNNQIKLTEMFSGDHPLLTQGFSAMTIRFFILQSHYRSTLDFGSTALEASEKAFKRLWEAYEILMKLSATETRQPILDVELNEKIVRLVNEFDDFMDDDFSTAKILANMFELASTINSFKDKLIDINLISAETLSLLQKGFKTYLEDIFGLRNSSPTSDSLEGVMHLLIDIRREAKSKKDYATSDKIRNQLARLGIELKDDKDGNVSWSSV